MGLGRLEQALAKVVAARPAEAKIKAARRDGRLDGAEGDALLERALAAGVIERDELERLREAAAMREEAIRVDAFTTEEYREMRG